MSCAGIWYDTVLIPRPAVPLAQLMVALGAWLTCSCHTAADVVILAPNFRLVFHSAFVQLESTFNGAMDKWKRWKIEDELSEGCGARDAHWEYDIL